MQGRSAAGLDAGDSSSWKWDHFSHKCELRSRAESQTCSTPALTLTQLLPLSQTGALFSLERWKGQLHWERGSCSARFSRYQRTQQSLQAHFPRPGTPGRLISGALAAPTNIALLGGLRGGHKAWLHFRPAIGRGDQNSLDFCILTLQHAQQALTINCTYYFQSYLQTPQSHPKIKQQEQK